MFCCHWARLVGEKAEMTAGPGLTEKPLIRVATSLPVVTVTLRAPRAASGSTVMVAVAAVGEETVNGTTLTPGPKLATLVPCTKCVNSPLMLMVVLPAPWGRNGTPRGRSVGIPG